MKSHITIELEAKLCVIPYLVIIIFGAEMLHKFDRIPASDEKLWYNEDLVETCCILPSLDDFFIWE